eukprot:470723_1
MFTESDMYCHKTKNKWMSQHIHKKYNNNNTYYYKRRGMYGFCPCCFGLPQWRRAKRNAIKKDTMMQQYNSWIDRSLFTIPKHITNDNYILKYHKSLHFNATKKKKLAIKTNQNNQQRTSLSVSAKRQAQYLSIFNDTSFNDYIEIDYVKNTIDDYVLIIEFWIRHSQITEFYFSKELICIIADTYLISNFKWKQNKFKFSNICYNKKIISNIGYKSFEICIAKDLVISSHIYWLYEYEIKILSDIDVMYNQKQSKLSIGF